MNLVRIRMWLITLVLGMGLMFFGLQSIAAAWNQPELTDDQIIQRARELGMVELKEVLEPGN